MRNYLCWQQQLNFVPLIAFFFNIKKIIWELNGVCIDCFLPRKYPHAYREYLHSRLVLSSLAHLFIKSYLRSHTLFSYNLLWKIPVWPGQLFPPLSLRKPNELGKNAIFYPSFSPFVNSFKCVFTLSWWKMVNSHNKRLYWEV